MKKILTINLVFFLFVLLFDGIYYGLRFTDLNFGLVTMFKGIASFLFFLQNLTNIIFCRKLKPNNIIIPSVLCVGQLFAFIADVVINFNFIIGAILFAIGHIFFAVAFYLLNKFNKMDIICILSVMAFAICFLTLYPYFNFKGMSVVIYIYAIIISIMLGKAISNFVTNKNSKLHLVIFLGALLFFLSDFMLVLSLFARGYEITNFLCLLLYYPAECLLAFSVVKYYE